MRVDRVVAPATENSDALGGVSAGRYLVINGSLAPMAPTAMGPRRKRGRPSYGISRFQICTSLPLDVRDAVDVVATTAGVSRIVAVADLIAQALGRGDLALRLPAPRGPVLTPAEVGQIASRRPDPRGWPAVTTLVATELLPVLEDLAAKTGVSRRRIVANLVTHMVGHGIDLNHDDVVWPNQGRFPLAI